jgi:hypothetical protein
MASARLDLSKSCVMDSEPRQSVDSKLMVVETDADDLLSAKRHSF